jgi:glutamate-1-semialdehyde 2,1-aminomutase
MTSSNFLQSRISGRNLKASEKLALRAEKCDAWAATRHEIVPEDQLVEGEYPLYASRADGAYFWDVDGNRYIDYILGYGTVVLGHNDPRVTNAVIQDLQTGTNISPLWRPIQVELTELLVSVIPGAEMAFLMRTGSDATSGALRLARIYTGRDKVVRWGYNGWHDWSCSRQTGVPEGVQSDVLTFSYNDAESLRKIFKANPGKIACVLMMSLELQFPLPGFLEEVRNIAHEHGALFILDEMRSGFRMALGGAQQFFNVRPDLSTFSKAMSNGHPISAIVGRADVLLCLGRTHMASTFYANSAEMAAAVTTIHILKESNAIQHIWAMGEVLQRGLRELISKFHVEAEVVGYPPSPFLRFTSPDRLKRQSARDAFFTETTRKGVFFHPGHHWFVSAAHSPQDIEETLAVCQAGFQVVQR